MLTEEERNTKVQIYTSGANEQEDDTAAACFGRRAKQRVIEARSSICGEPKPVTTEIGLESGPSASVQYHPNARA